MRTTSRRATNNERPTGTTHSIQRGTSRGERCGGGDGLSRLRTGRADGRVLSLLPSSSRLILFALQFGTSTLAVELRLLFILVRSPRTLPLSLGLSSLRRVPLLFFCLSFLFVLLGRGVDRPRVFLSFLLLLLFDTSACFDHFRCKERGGKGNSETGRTRLVFLALSLRLVEKG